MQKNIKIKNSFEKAFSAIKGRKSIPMIFLIALFLCITYSRYIKTLAFVVLFIVIGGLSKFYHRLFRSTLGIDLVLFLTIMISLAYRNLLLSLFAGWLGLVAADTIGQKFSHMSLVSLVSLTIVALTSRLLLGLPTAMAAIVLTVAFEAVSAVFYYFMGSPPDKIALFLASHFIFNLFLILSFSGQLIVWMV